MKLTTLNKTFQVERKCILCPMVLLGFSVQTKQDLLQSKEVSGSDPFMSTRESEKI